MSVVSNSDRPEALDLAAGTVLSEAAGDLPRDKRNPLVAARIGDRVLGLSEKLDRDARVEFLRFSSPEGREVYRHSAAHVMAHAVKRLFPEARLGIGPAIEDGFYYDFDVDGRLTEEDLPRIEEEMSAIVKENLPLERQEIGRPEAERQFREAGETYKVELLSEMENEAISTYTEGDFTDLCRGPHLPSTGMIRAFKLTALAGAYWRGDEKRPMLQRIYGTAYPDRKELKEHLRRLEEARKRDHRRLGVDLDLFSIHEEAGAGLAYWHPKGSVIRSTIEDFWRSEHTRRGYSLVFTPHIARSGLWKASGHLDYYAENMYLLDVDDEQYVLKPMNCVGHILIYKSRKRSYRELPVRMAELGTVYRRERSGTLHGLLRVRGFTQDDAHIFCTPEQAVDEIVAVVELAVFMMRTFGFTDYQVDLSVRDPERPGDYAGSDEEWSRAESSLVEALDRLEMPYTRMEGEAVFYGPKIDMKLLDALGRGWQGPTIQFDFNLPGRLGVEYVGRDGRPHNVFMIHRTVLGGLERFMGNLIEHYAGAFPVWLAPVQASVLPVMEDCEGYAREVADRLREKGIRVEVVGSQQKLGYRIRTKTMEKIPYILVVGEKEKTAGGVAVRRRGTDSQDVMDVDRFVETALAEIQARSL
jgi:threonyl-tRNA synthetase